MAVSDEQAETFTRIWAELGREERDEMWTLVIEGGRPSRPLWDRLQEVAPGSGYRVLAQWADDPDADPTEVLVVDDTFRQWLLDHRDDLGFPT